MGMDGHRVQDVVENLLFLLEFLKARPWAEQKVEDFLKEVMKRPSWPNARFKTHVCDVVASFELLGLICSSGGKRPSRVAPFLDAPRLLHPQKEI